MTRYWVDSLGQLHRTRPVQQETHALAFTVEWFASSIDGWVSLDDSGDGAYRGATPEEVAKRHGWEEWSAAKVNGASWRVQWEKPSCKIGSKVDFRDVSLQVVRIEQLNHKIVEVRLQ
jgi:hypothetical protein